MKEIIIQAGGRGSRLETLTANKPKCLVPVDNLPLIFHLFKKYPEANFTIIGDYKRDVLDSYLKTFAEVDYKLIFTDDKGTCSGIQAALKNIKDEQSFMLIWCDILLSEHFSVPNDGENIDCNYVGISGDFECRWSFNNSEFIKAPSSENGVSGLFVFKNKAELKNIPKEGEFVRWLSEKAGLNFERLMLKNSKEIGTMISYFQNEINKPRSRPFNKLSFEGDLVKKTPVDEQGKKLAEDETAWYKFVAGKDFKNVPEIHQYQPLTMDRVNGENIYKYSHLIKNFKKPILEKIVNGLKELHEIADKKPANKSDIIETYKTKTFDRLNKVKDLIPHANAENIVINGKSYKNIFANIDHIGEMIESFVPSNFSLIHGDCTFSNILLESEGVKPVFIDPRGYFGSSKLFGDEDYDWAKLYYSIKGNYDQFNLKNFSLEITGSGVEIYISSNNWEEMEDLFFELTGANKQKIKLLHALIWLSLTTYSWEDYDSICGAFYLGIMHLNEVL